MMIRTLTAVFAMLSTAALSASTPLAVRNGPIRMPSRPHAFISAGDLTARITEADAAAAAGRPINGEPLLFQDGHRVTMEWRNAPQNGINVHLKDSEMFVILQGSGEITLGGTLVNPHAQRDNAFEHATISSMTVEGARRYPIAKGDMIMIPAGTPHSVSQVNGKLVLWSMILPNDPNGSPDKAVEGPPLPDAVPPGHNAMPKGL